MNKINAKQIEILKHSLTNCETFHTQRHRDKNALTQSFEKINKEDTQLFCNNG